MKHEHAYKSLVRLLKRLDAAEIHYHLSCQRDGAISVEGAIPDDVLKKYTWRFVGPSNMGGRITAISVVESDPATYFIATASGGLLKTSNNGTTFQHLFDKEPHQGRSRCLVQLGAYGLEVHAQRVCGHPVRLGCGGGPRASRATRLCGVQCFRRSVFPGAGASCSIGRRESGRGR